MNNIRNFSIIAHERGITIKAQTARLNFKSADGQEYQLNLIDTPGHVDFSYEVSRSLAACEGAILVIDASQGVEAQTLANTYLALHNDLVLVPVINKIDLQAADVEGALEQLENVVGISRDEALLASAKTGQNVTEVLEAIVKRVPPPKGDPESPLKALLFDAWFDTYRGVVVLVRVIDGQVKVGDPVRMMGLGDEYTVEELGWLTPKPVKADRLSAGEVGYLIAGIKTLGQTRIGDTITHRNRPAAEALPGFKEAKPMVFCGLFPAGDTRLFSTRTRTRWPWARAIAAAFWACCTARSSRSAWSASSA
jgi:GTP-binding protein LepA